MPESTEFSILAGLLRPLPLLAAHWRRDAAPWLAAAGIEPASLTRPGARITLRAAAELLHLIARDTGRQDTGLQLGALHQPGDLGALGYLWLSAPDLAQAIAAGRRYEAFVQGGETFDYAITGNRLILQYSAPSLPPALRRQDAEFTFAILLTAWRRMTGRSITPLAVIFAHGAPADTRPHRRFFGRQPGFGGAGNALVLEAATLTHPLPGSDPGLFAILQDYLSDACRALDGRAGFQAALARAILAQLPRGARLDDIAAAMGLAPRSLQRRLQAAGMSLRQERARLREAQAADILAEPGISIAAASARLGYQSPAAFARAWRQRHGTAPSARRRAARADTAGPRI